MGFISATTRITREISAHVQPVRPAASPQEVAEWLSKHSVAMRRRLAVAQ
jgi:hypothetical protein